MKNIKTLVNFLIFSILVVSVPTLKSQVSGTVKDIDGNPIEASVNLLGKSYATFPKFIEEIRTTNGEFISENENRDNFILVIPDDELYVPGYFKKDSNIVYEWKNASELLNTGSEYNIKAPYNVILDTVTPTTGPGKIFGEIVIERFAKSKKQKDSPLDRNLIVLVYLFDNTGAIRKYLVKNDLEGYESIEYSLNDIDTGTYYLLVELPFFERLDIYPIEIIITENNLNVEKNLSFLDATNVKESNIKSDLLITPNPFTNSTTIKYTLDNPSQVRISIYDAFGKEITTLKDEFQDAGEHQAIFNAENFPQGMYYYTIQIGQQTDNGKLLLIK